MIHNHNASRRVTRQVTVLNRVRGWVQSVIADPLPYEGDVSEMAGDVGLARSRFAQLVRQETGDSPSRFITRQRVLLAAQLLTNTKRTVTDIALSCNFSSTQHFCQGVCAVGLASSPSAYRRTHGVMKE